MFFALSKILGLVVQPVNFLALLGLFGLILCLTRIARAGRIIVATAILCFAVVGFSPLSSLLLRPLEDRFPRVETAAVPAPSGIIVLGGSLDEDIGLARGEPTLTEAVERLTSAVALARKYPNARLVFTGGSAGLRQTGADEARGVRELWASLGVPESQMVMEDKSRNTFENATMTRAMVDPKPGETWLLVTSAAHMPRSVGIFRKVGWDVVAYPVDYRTFGDVRDYKLSTIALDGLKRLDVALHEWFGLVAYRLTGKTDSLFPAPDPVTPPP